jgi:hypothetical protein
MTPLAYELLEDIGNPAGIRIRCEEVDRKRQAELLRAAVWSCKFFDCSQVWQTATHLAKPMFETFEELDIVDQRLAFLPAIWTWIESENPGFRDDPAFKHQSINGFESAQKEWTYTYRTAHIFIGVKDSTHIARRFLIGYETPRLHPFRIWRLTELPTLPLVHSNLKPQRQLTIKNPSGDVQHFETPTARADDFVHYAALALINTPHVIGQKIHWPHERIERDKLKQLRLPGKFPVRAWTEIILKVLPPDSAEESAEQHALTGERCLHYCRTYLRVRFGKIEHVEGHWRGNAVFGIKRSRYKVELT